jgi:hypothetical protein
MGMSVDVFMYDWSELVDNIVDGGGYDRSVVEDVLIMYGEKICDKYVLVSDEYMGDYDPMWSMCAALKLLFDIDEPDELLFGVEDTCIKGYSGSCIDEEEELKRLSKRLIKE